MLNMEYALEKFWDRRMWLPPNVTWEDLEPNGKIQYTNHNHLYYPLPMALVMLIIRYFLEK